MSDIITIKALVTIHVERAYAFDAERGVWLRRQEEADIIVPNLLTNTGRDQLHVQGYDTTGLASNGFNYIGLSNDATSPSATDTTLASELSGNGLTRAQGVYAHTTGTNTTTISNTFTYTGSSQAVQKAGLFNLSSAGVMGHETSFTQRTLFTNDTLAVTWTITLG